VLTRRTVFRCFCRPISSRREPWRAPKVRGSWRANLDDLGDLRPGVAARDRGAKPDAGGGTGQAAFASCRALGLPTWEKPAAGLPRLADPTRDPGDDQRLSQVGAEPRRSLGFRPSGSDTTKRSRGSVAAGQARDCSTRPSAPPSSGRKPPGISTWYSTPATVRATGQGPEGRLSAARSLTPPVAILNPRSPQARAARSAASAGQTVAAIGPTVRPGAAGRFAPFEGASGFGARRICSNILHPPPFSVLRIPFRDKYTAADPFGKARRDSRGLTSIATTLQAGSVL
jgi:hypothetical protein